MSNNAKNKAAIRKIVKDLQNDLNKEAKRQKLSVPMQTDIVFNGNIPIGHRPIGYSPFSNSNPTNITNNNFDNRGATIGAIGNENTIIQNINNPQLHDLLELISISTNAVNALDIEDEEKEWLTYNLNNCHAEVESSSPKLSLIKRFTSTVKNELETIKDSFVSLSKDIAPLTTILVNVPKIYELAERLFGS